MISTVKRQGKEPSQRRACSASSRAAASCALFSLAATLSSLPWASCSSRSDSSDLWRAARVCSGHLFESQRISGLVVNSAMHPLCKAFSLPVLLVQLDPVIPKPTLPPRRQPRHHAAHLLQVGLEPARASAVAGSQTAGEHIFK